MPAARTSPLRIPETGRPGDPLRVRDWSGSPLGVPDAWPPALRPIAGAMLESSLPAFVVWGAQRILLCNDACTPLLGHPAATARPVQDVLPENWSAIGPLVDRALAGESFRIDDLELTVDGDHDDRHARAWFTLHCSPLRDAHGAVSGMQAGAVDTTGRMVTARRQAFLLSLTDALQRMSDPHAILQKAAELVGRHLKASRMMYGEADAGGNSVTFHSHFTDGSVPPLNGALALDAFGAAVGVLTGGGTLVVDDIDADPLVGEPTVRDSYAAVQTHAFLSVPVLRQERVTIFLTASQSTPRRWTGDDVAIVEEAAQRTRGAVEHARAQDALRRLNRTLEERVAVRTLELERAQQETLHAAARLQFTLGAAKIGDWDLDLVHDTAHRSLRHDQCFGYTEPVAEWGLDEFLRHVHPDDRDDVTRQFRHAIDRREDWHFDCRVVWPDRSIHWIAAHGSIYEADGRPTRMSGIVSDITERKQAEERLRLLDRIGEVTRAAVDPNAIMAATTRLLGRHLHVTRCAYADLEADNDRFTIRHDWTADGAASTVGVYSLDLFGSRAAADMREGRTLVVRDVDRELSAADGADMFNAIGIKAIICCPLVKANRLVAMMAVHQDAPRDWSGDDVALVEQIVERSWAHIERVRVTEALRDSEAHLALLFAQSAAGIAEVGLDGRMLRVNDRYCRILGRSREQLIGAHVKDLFYPDDREENFRLLKRLLETGEPFEVENRYLLPDGEPVWVSKTVSTIRTADGKAATSVMAVVLDITERRQAEEKVRHAALHDPLTGLPNRSMLSEVAAHLLSHNRRTGQVAAVLFLDLDRFKPINDTHGHEVGDAVLKEAARRLACGLREEDVVIRLGGDEFVILLQDIRDAGYAADVARHVLTRIAEPYHVEDLALSLSASIGIAVFPRDGDAINPLIGHADIAMYQAKQAGRNNFQFYSPEFALETRMQLAIEQQLKSALQTREFHLCYQPIVDIGSGEIVSVEALLRWPNADIGPDRFIPVAEATGIINPIGRWLLREASRQHRLWTEHGLPPVPIAVNVSVVEFRDKDFVGRYTAMLREHGIDASAIQLEVTETAVMDDVEHAVDALNRLKALGTTILLDDFGTGQSSLAYLARLPLNKIKIDKSFILRLASDAASRTVTDAMIALGRALGLEVVAEGIESAEMLDYVRARGCHQAQGYYLCRPQSGPALEAWYRERRAGASRQAV